MKRTPLALAPVLALLSGACTPTCTCPATAPAPGGIPAPAAPPAAAAAPAASPAPAAQPGPAPAAAPAPGPLQLVNAQAAARRMRSLYPRHLSDAGVRGDVVLDVTVAANGTVESVEQVETTNEQFTGAALTVAQELRFSEPPAAGTVVRVRMRFQPAGTRIDIVERQGGA